MEHILEIRDLVKRYDTFTLDQVSFSVPAGAIVGLIGENGAGKSTTISAALGLIARDGGTVSFWGQELSPELKEDIGVVFDEVNFYGGLSAKKIGRIAAGAYRNWDDALYQSYLARFSLPSDKPIKTFSKGMKAKLCIAVALSHHPRLLILDEATVGLDPVVRDDILDVFLEFVQDEKHAILMSSHITTDLEKVADYIVFIHGGKVLFSKTKDELRYRYGILRCGAEQFESVDKADLLTYRREPHQISALVADKELTRRKYPDTVVDDATIDEIMLLYVKGERV